MNADQLAGRLARPHHDAYYDDGNSLAPAVMVNKAGGYPLRYWNDGFGPLWVYCETLGVVGVVRAMTWEDAYGCVEDEIMDGATYAEIVDYFGDDGMPSRDELPDWGYWFRGEPSSPWCSGEYATPDQNGHSLRRLTPEEAERLGLTVNVPWEV